MPIYKITERRLKRKERDEELGLDEIKAKMREMGEMDNETDSDESDSDSESEDGSEDDEEAGEEDGSGEEDEGSDEEEAEGEEDEEDAGDEEEEDDDEDDLPPMTPAQALESPLYEIISPITHKPIHLCALCPGRILKSETDRSAHLTSKMHSRSHKRFAEHLAKGNVESDDPREIAEALLEELEGGLDAKKENDAGEGRTPKRGRGRKSGGASTHAGADKADGVAVSATTSPAKAVARSKKQRKAAKAQKLVEAQTALAHDSPASKSPAPAEAPVAKSKKRKTSKAAPASDSDVAASQPKLNRAARRLLQQRASSGGAGTALQVGKAGKGAPTTKDVAAAPGKGKGKEKEKAEQAKPSDGPERGQAKTDKSKPQAETAKGEEGQKGQKLNKGEGPEKAAGAGKSVEGAGAEKRGKKRARKSGGTVQEVVNA